MKDFFKINKILFIVEIVSFWIFFIVSFNFLEVGKYINFLFQCKDSIYNSFPCYWLYSIIIMVINLIIFDISSILLAIKYFKITNKIFIKIILLIILILLFLLALWIVWFIISSF